MPQAPKPQMPKKGQARQQYEKKPQAEKQRMGGELPQRGSEDEKINRAGESSDFRSGEKRETPRQRDT